MLCDHIYSFTRTHSRSYPCVLAHIKQYIKIVVVVVDRRMYFQFSSLWCVFFFSFCLSCRLNFSVLLCIYAHIKLIDVLYFIAFSSRFAVFFKKKKQQQQKFYGSFFFFSFYLWSEEKSS